MAKKTKGAKTHEKKINGFNRNIRRRTLYRRIDTLVSVPRFIFRGFPIGVRTKRDFIDQIELGQLCHIKVEVKGHKKPREDGSPA